jgi:hypothetical protein
MSKLVGAASEYLAQADAEKRNVDAAWKFLNEHNGANVTTENVDIGKIRRKVDWRIVPLMFACYLMQFLDKVILNVSIFRDGDCANIY